jgi:hypothetical protein
MTVDLSAALDANSDEGATLALAQLWDVTDDQRRALAIQLLEGSSSMLATSPAAIRRALECFLIGDLIDDPRVLADLCVAGLRAGREDTSLSDLKGVSHHAATSAISRYFSGQHLRRTPRTGDAALFWDAAVGASGFAQTDAHAAISGARVERNASWYIDWFTVTAPTRFLDPLHRHLESDQFVEVVAKGDPQRRAVARGTINEWTGTFASFDETVTHLVARGY